MVGHRKRMKKDGMNLQAPVLLEGEEGQLLNTPQDVFALAENVFGNDLLRDIIVSHAIHQEDGSLDTATVCSLRALGKDWNDSVCRRLHKNAEPLYQIMCGEQIVLSGKLYKKGTAAKFLDTFSNTLAYSSRVPGRSPTFEVAIFEKAFHANIYDSLYNFLVGCGQGLVKIQLEIPMDGLSIKGNFATFFLPSLHKATFHLNSSCSAGRIPHVDNVIYLLQLVFNGATSLKQVDIVTQFANKKQPTLFERIVLPPTLSQVRLLGQTYIKDMEILLLKNPLPNLTSLSLSMSKTPETEGLLSRILERFRLTLRKLILSSDYRSPVIIVRFPIMERLEVFNTLRSEKFVPESAGSYSLETYLPKLKMLRFCFQSSDNILPWVNGSKYLSVKELYIGSEYVMSLEIELLSQLQFSFPNITQLELWFSDISIAAVQCIFTGMKNLVKLKMVRERSFVFEDVEMVRGWDSVLIGTSVGFTERLRASPKLWDKIQLNMNDTPSPSIRKLTNLRSLSLEDDSLYEVVTDVAFHFAFLKMPALHKLEFSGKCSISPEIVDKWRMTGRILNFIPE